MSVSVGTISRAVLYGAFFILFFVGAFWLGLYAQESSFVQGIVSQYGYIGIFFVSAISGFNILVPLPAISFLPLFLASGLGFAATIIVITLGMTLGDGVGFVIGRAGRRAMEASGKKRTFRRLEALRERHHLAPVILLFFYAAFVPLPNELLIIPLGFLGYKAIHLLLPVLVGNAIFNLLSAIGVTSLFDFLT